MEVRRISDLLGMNIHIYLYDKTVKTESGPQFSVESSYTVVSVGSAIEHASTMRRYVNLHTVKLKEKSIGMSGLSSLIRVPDVILFFSILSGL